MSKNKLARFAEMETFDHVIQVPFNHVYNNEFRLKGKWNIWFENAAPIVLELGCGKGEYAVGLARAFPEKNFLGVDIKGARMWKGAKDSYNEKLKNVGFIRTRIETIRSFFAPEEVTEIWITFPDPQLKKRRAKKRLTNARFLNDYKTFLAPGGKIHLKTDNLELYEYTLRLVKHNGLSIEALTPDLYHSQYVDDTKGIYTFYEKMFLSEGVPIKYLRFNLDTDKPIQEPPDDEE